MIYQICDGMCEIFRWLKLIFIETALHIISQPAKQRCIDFLDL